jgi:tetratricopeptide (TPR) repeat protein
MNEAHDPNRTVDVPSAPADSLDAGLAAGFAAPYSSLGATQPRPLKEAEADSARPVAAAPAEDLPAVPGYRVLREIARGGMGRVLAAYDLALDRDVALKVLLPGAKADRFVRESKITARLPHPGIPPVHALGTLADGSPFLAMKLIAGQTLAAEMKTADRPRLLQAFTQVCQAVGFAHSRGVIHRDLKPGNVMVGAFGEVQVMDWGLAKDLTVRPTQDEPCSPQAPTASLIGAGPEQTTDYRSAGESTDERTQAGTVLGTPAYMAPEQARGEATDARADVFALGGILCAILTGQPPFAGKTARDVIRRAGVADLAEAFGRLDGCGADAELVSLCRRCLSPDPADRPADGQATADRLSAYLNGVQERLHAAERERAVAVAREAEQRKRRKVQLALAATVLLAVLGGAVAVSIYRVQAEQARSDEAVRAAAERGRQGRNAEAVARLLDQAEEALRAGEAAKAKVALEAAKKRSAEGGSEKEAQRLGRLDADLTLLRNLDDIDQFRWTWSADQFPGHRVVATRTREALARFGADPGAASAEGAAARVSASVVRERIVSALDRLLWQQKSAGVRALLRRVDADPYRDAVRDAVLARDGATIVELAQRKAALEQPAGFAAFLGEIGDIKVERRRQSLQAAVIRWSRNLGLLMALGNSYPNDQKESADERVRWFQAAVAAAPANYAAHTNLGAALGDMGRWDEAIASYRKAVELGPRLARARSGLGAVLYGKGKVDEAIASCRKAIELDPKYAWAHYNLGVALDGKGQVDEAIASYRKAVALDPKNALAHYELGNALRGKGQVDEAIACYHKAIELDPKHADAHTGLGVVLCNIKKDYDGAIACFRKVIALDPKDDLAHYNLGNALRGKGQVDEAIASYRRAVALDPKHADAHAGLGAALSDKGQVDEAIASYRKAVALDPKRAAAHSALGALLCDRKHDYDAAIASFRTAIALDPKNAFPHANLGNALRGKGQVDEAIACYKKAIELDPKFAPFRTVLAEAARLAAARNRFAAFQNGSYTPASNDERLGLIEWCQIKKLHRTAARLYAAAFAADPKLADDLNAGHRYDAACSAALAAAGQGEDAAKVDDKERARLRTLALDWLRADLVLRTRQLESGKPADRAAVRQALRHWQQDTDLAGLRDQAALAKLPAEERAAYEKLWADVVAILKKAGEETK